MAERWQQWMPFHIDRFRGSPEVQAMHPSARIGFLYLLASAWQTDDCTVSADPLDLATESGLGDELWAQYGGRILRKFQFENGRYRNTVVFEEWSDAKRVFESRQSNARRTHSKRSSHDDHEHSKSTAPCNADTQTVTGTVTTTGTEEKTSTLASTALAVPAARGKLAGTFPLNQGEHEVYEADVQQWHALYPAVDVRQELRSIKGWCLSNPLRRKTKSGITRFINSWLSRAQNETKTGANNGNRDYSKTGQNLDAAKGALAILAEADRNSCPADEMLTPEGSTAERGELSHLRSGSIELQP